MLRSNGRATSSPARSMRGERCRNSAASLPGRRCRIAAGALPGCEHVGWATFASAKSAVGGAWWHSSTLWRQLRNSACILSFGLKARCSTYILLRPSWACGMHVSRLCPIHLVHGIGQPDSSQRVWQHLLGIALPGNVVARCARVDRLTADISLRLSEARLSRWGALRLSYIGVGKSYDRARNKVSRALACQNCVCSVMT